MMTATSIEALLSGLTAAVEANTSILERVVAGQEAAMAKLDGATGSTRKPRAAKTEETPAPAAAETPAAAPAFPQLTVADEAGLKAHVSGWTGAAGDDAEKAKRVQFLKDAAAHLGTEPKFPVIAAKPDVMKKIVFFVARKQGGADVDFAAAYDFDGDPAQEVAAAAEDDFG